jgi:zinc transport system permease protein
MTDFLDVLQQSYFQRAIVASAIVGLTCPAIGVFLVLRRLSLIGDGIGHVSFAGVTAAFMGGFAPLLGAGIFTVLGALGIERLRSWRRDHGDLALAIVFYGALALGVVLASAARRLNAGVIGYLFGSVLTVTDEDLLLVAAASGGVLLVLALVWRTLFAVTYDEELARAAGLPVVALNYGIMLLTAVTVVASLRVVGTLLVAGLLVIPVAVALQIARGFRQALALAMGFGLLSSLLGLLVAYHFDLAPSGTVVLTAIALFLLAGIVGDLIKRPRFSSAARPRHRSG